MKEALGAFLALVVTVVGLVWLISIGMETKCRRQWEGSGMKSEFLAPGGCMITLPDGRKIPAANYREP